MVGFQSAVEMSAWFSSLEKRETRPDGHLRDSSASMALADQRYDEATKGYVWLWNNIPGLDDTYEYGWMGVRQSFMLKPLGSLVNCHPPAHEAFSSGVVLLARGRTVGLLLALVAASMETVLAVSIHQLGMRAIVGLLLGPGFLFIVAAAAAYVTPIWRFLRAR